MVLLILLCGPVRFVLQKKYPKKGIFGICLPCCFPFSGNKTAPSTPQNHTISNTTHRKDPPPDIETVYETLKESREMKEGGDDLDAVIRNIKRSAANRAIMAHKLDTEND